MDPVARANRADRTVAKRSHEPVCTCTVTGSSWLDSCVRSSMQGLPPLFGRVGRTGVPQPQQALKQLSYCPCLCGSYSTHSRFLATWNLRDKGRRRGSSSPRNPRSGPVQAKNPRPIVAGGYVQYNAVAVTRNLGGLHVRPAMSKPGQLTSARATHGRIVS